MEYELRKLDDGLEDDIVLRAKERFFYGHEHKYIYVKKSGDKYLAATDFRFNNVCIETMDASLFIDQIYFSSSCKFVTVFKEVDVDYLVAKSFLKVLGKNKVVCKNGVYTLSYPQVLQYTKEVVLAENNYTRVNYGEKSGYKSAVKYVAACIDYGYRYDYIYRVHALKDGLERAYTVKKKDNGEIYLHCEGIFSEYIDTLFNITVRGVKYSEAVKKLVALGLPIFYRMESASARYFKADFGITYGVHDISTYGYGDSEKEAIINVWINILNIVKRHSQTIFKQNNVEFMFDVIKQELLPRIPYFIFDDITYYNIDGAYSIEFNKQNKDEGRQFRYCSEKNSIVPCKVNQKHIGEKLKLLGEITVGTGSSVRIEFHSAKYVGMAKGTFYVWHSGTNFCAAAENLWKEITYYLSGSDRSIYIDVGGNKVVYYEEKDCLVRIYRDDVGLEENHILGKLAVISGITVSDAVIIPNIQVTLDRVYADYCGDNSGIAVGRTLTESIIKLWEWIKHNRDIPTRPICCKDGAQYYYDKNTDSLVCFKESAVKTALIMPVPDRPILPERGFTRLDQRCYKQCLHGASTDVLESRPNIKTLGDLNGLQWSMISVRDVFKGMSDSVRYEVIQLAGEK